MKILSCEACGGSLERIDNGDFVCVYCGTKQTLDSYGANARENVYKDEASQRYDEALLAKIRAKCSADYTAAANMFEGISTYRDSERLMRECICLAAACHKEETYVKAKSLMLEGTPHFLSKAAELFEEIPGWEDSDELKTECLEKAKSINTILANRRMRTKERHRRERRKSQTIWICIITVAALLYIAFCVYIGSI